MKILICSDGMPAADNATRLGALVAAPSRAQPTLLGIAEKPQDEPSLRGALETQAQSLREQGVVPEIVVLAGEPIRQILNQTSRTKYDLVIIGSRLIHFDRVYFGSQKTYENINIV